MAFPLAFLGFVLKISYRLKRLRLWGQPLNRWLFFLCLLGVLTVATDLIESGPVADAVVILVGLGLMLALLWAGRTRYLIFRRAEHPSLSDSVTDVPQLAPEEKVPVRSSGHFEVSGMRRYFVEAQAYFETVETREHIIIAWTPQRDLLGLAASPREETGLWYIFFMPATIQGVEVGEVHFGLRPRPALKVVYQSEAGSRETVYLSFDHPEQQEAVLADLRCDAPLP
jgi:hypothetical protein